MSWLFQSLPGAGAEQLSESPTVDADTILNIAPIGYAATDTPTLGKMKAGSMSCKLVAVIEGCEFLLSDCASAAALHDAYADTDWSAASIVSGLYVELRNNQSIDPQSAFATSGKCLLRILDTDGADTFGTMINKRLAGAETELTQTATRSDTTLHVKSTTGFPSSGTVYLGAESIAYTGVTSTSFTGCTRGMYSAFSCDSSGSGTRFANHHRWGLDSRYIQAQPIVTQLPRVWLGRRVAVYLHTWDGSALNSRVNAQLVYAGRIVSITDDPTDFSTVIELEHFAREWEEAVIGRDLFQAEIPLGMWITAGRTFSFVDGKDGTKLTANSLTVVSSGASGANQMNEGFYSNNQIAEIWNRWLASEKAAGRIYGSYSWSSPVMHRTDGMRTICRWTVNDAGTKKTGFYILAPMEVLIFMGLADAEPAQTGLMGSFISGPDKYTNTSHTDAGTATPYTALVFFPSGPGRISQEFSDSIIYDLDNERGTFADQRSLLPASVLTGTTSGQLVGFFMLDDRALMIGTYDSTNHRFKDCWLAPYQATADKDASAVPYIGRRADEPQAPVRVRQVFILEGTFDTIFKTLAYSSGVTWFNHGTYDTLGNGLGVGLPGSLLGADFERSVTNLPDSGSPIVIVIDEPTKFVDLISSDLLIRRGFVRWRDQGFEIAQWQTPVAALAVAELTEGNKAEPSGQKADHRAPSIETDQYQKTQVKFDYERDFATGRNDQYLKSLSIEDQGATDQTDGASGGRVQTLQMRNTFTEFANTGASIEALIPKFMVTMPMFSRAGHRLTRSIDSRFFEGYSVGDVVTITDSYARDPLTGRRGIAERPAAIVRHWYDIGGPSPDGTTRQMAGGVDLMFLDVHRGSAFSPSADIDSTANAGGFSAGYNSSTKAVRCKGHSYSLILTLGTKRGHLTYAEPRDATNFEAGDKITVVERDPANPASPTSWTDTVVSQSGDDLVLTTGLAGWDATKQYRIISQSYLNATTTQQDDAYQADATDMMIADTDPAYHPVSGSEQDYRDTADIDAAAELIPDLAYGDGKPWDVAYDRVIANTLNLLADRKTTVQNPLLWAADSPAAAAGTSWDAIFAGVVWFGMVQPGNAISRLLTVAPWFRSSSGASASVRVTLSRLMPMVRIGSEDLGLDAHSSTRFGQFYSQTATWTTSSTTWAIGEDKTLDLSVKDIFFGLAWLTIEAKDAAEVRGLGKCIEGIRVAA